MRSYILYKDKIVFSEIIDIEVSYVNLPKIKRKIMFEAKDDMMQLNNRILEVCGHFPKLSNLKKLTIKNCKKKTEKGYVDLKCVGIIGNSLKSKDLIVFDLNFTDIWIEVNMICESKELSSLFSFETKVPAKCNKTLLRNTLAKIAITYWAECYKNENYDYFIFSNIEIEDHHNDIKVDINNDLENKEKKYIHFNYNSTIKVKVSFKNLTFLIYQELPPSRNHIFKIKNEINTEILKYLNNNTENGDYNNSTVISNYYNIIWIWKDTKEECITDDNNSINETYFNMQNNNCFDNEYIQKADSLNEHKLLYINNTQKEIEMKDLSKGVYYLFYYRNLIKIFLLLMDDFLFLNILKIILILNV